MMIDPANSALTPMAVLRDKFDLECERFIGSEDLTMIEIDDRNMLIVDRQSQEDGGGHGFESYWGWRGLKMPIVGKALLVGHRPDSGKLIDNSFKWDTKSLIECLHKPNVEMVKL